MVSVEIFVDSLSVKTEEWAHHNTRLMSQLNFDEIASTVPKRRDHVVGVGGLASTPSRRSALKGQLMLSRTQHREITLSKHRNADSAPGGLDFSADTKEMTIVSPQVL